jgi:hypothetical protein
VQRLRVQDAVRSLGGMKIRSGGNFASEFVRSPDFSFPDALHFGPVPGIHIALVATLLVCDAPGASQRMLQPLDRAFR